MKSLIISIFLTVLFLLPVAEAAVVLNATDYIGFNISASELAKINSGGLVVTGGWVNSTNFNASNQICLGNICKTTWPSGALIGGSGSPGQVTFWTAADTISGDNNLFWDNTNKRLGIGTTSPQSLLHVVGTGNLLNVSTATTSLLFVNGTSGNVGIGTTTPGAKLDVVGDVKIGGNVAFSADNAYDIGSADTNRFRDLYQTGTHFFRPANITSNRDILSVRVGSEANPRHKVLIDTAGRLVFQSGPGGTTVPADALTLPADTTSSLIIRRGAYITGHFYPWFDNSYDIGAINSYRFRDIFQAGTHVFRPINLQITRPLIIIRPDVDTLPRHQISIDTAGQLIFLSGPGNVSPVDILTFPSDTTSAPIFNRGLTLSGNLTFSTDNAYDIGSTANRPRNVYVASGLGIGITTAPEQKLHVAGKIKIGNDATTPSAGTIRWTGTNFEGYDGTTWKTLDGGGGWTEDIANNVVYLTNSGRNVGIGTTGPASKLSVSGGASIGSGYAGTAAPTDGMIIQGNVGIGIGTMSLPTRLYVKTTDSTTIPFQVEGVVNGYRKPITIDNTQNSNTLTDYQVLVTLDTASLITAGKMRSDCGDIRFTDSDGSTQLSYWLESGCNTASTKIWVKVPSIPASSTKTIYVHYGNPSAESASNGDNTFKFFDDFLGNSLDTTKWVVYSNAGGNITVSNGIATLTSNSSINSSYTIRNTSLNTPFEVRWKARPYSQDEGYSAYEFQGIKKSDGSYNTAYYTWYNNRRSIVYGNEIDNSGPTPYGAMKIHKITSVGSTVRYYVDDAEVSNSPQTGSYSSSYVEFSVFRSDISGNSKLEVDWVFVRNFSSPEPTTSVGSESSAPYPATFFYIQTNGNIGIGTTTPNGKLHIIGSGSPDLNISEGTACSYIDAGATSFTVCSSKDIKENIKLFKEDDMGRNVVASILDRISSVPVYRYDFINGSRDNIGLLAEDFYKVFERGDGKTIKGDEVQMALWLAVQELIKENKQLKSELERLEAKVLKLESK
ncbi:MAG: DUF2341 domain-containing protein [Candidatus Aenigmatarchaeota archaeon]